MIVSTSPTETLSTGTYVPFYHGQVKVYTGIRGDVIGFTNGNILGSGVVSLTELGYGFV
ncbi:MAG: hypothetical protein JSV69_12105 [Chloroflexota bacterium]|nr:MAG: hypothetical protein JSV69_12105 [Chloroflexota bacterium]